LFFQITLHKGDAMKKHRKIPSRKIPDGAFLIGKRIALRALNKGDAPLFYKWINDPEVHQFLKMSYPNSIAEEEKWIESLPEKKATDVVFGIVLIETGKLIGVMGLHRISAKDGTAVTGSFIGEKQYWSKGYGTEAKMLVLEYAFNTLNLYKIRSMVFAFNGRSKRCLEKCGYHQEGVLKEQIYRNGQRVDEILMAIFKEDFLKLWAKYKKKYVV